MGKNTNPVGGSMLKLCLVIYMRRGDTRVPKLTHGRDDLRHLYCFLHVLEQRLGNKTDPMGGAALNVCIVFYTRCDDIWVMKLTPMGESTVNICIAITRVGGRCG